MRNLKFILIGALVLLSSCRKTYVFINHQSFAPYTYGVPQNVDNEYGIVFGNYNSATKASVTSVSGTGYDDFNLYTWNSINDTIMKPYLVKAIGAGSYSYENIQNQELQYFRNAADNYEFIGIVPTTKQTSVKDGIVTVKNITSAVVDDNRVIDNLTEDSPEEFLWSYKKVEKSDYNSIVSLAFNHGNSLLYLGFTSDRNDTKLLDYVPGIPGSPAVNDTTDVYFEVKAQSNLWWTSTTYSLTAKTITDEQIAYINSFYKFDSDNAGELNFASSNSSIHTLRLVKDIPAQYKDSYTMPNGDVCDFFSVAKYLGDAYISFNKPAYQTYPIVHVGKNSNNYQIVAFDYAASSGTPNSSPHYEISVTPAIPDVPAITGIRVFTAKIDNSHYVHEGHTITTDAKISSNGLVWDNITNSQNVIEMTIPTSTLSTTTEWSPSTFYGIPANSDITYFVIKFSYIYNGTMVYDVRVPIQLPTTGLEVGKYYKYTIHITSVSNGVVDPDEATTNKDEIDVSVNPVINVSASFNDYVNGDERTIII